MEQKNILIVLLIIVVVIIGYFVLGGDEEMNDNALANDPTYTAVQKDIDRMDEKMNEDEDADMLEASMEADEMMDELKDAEYNTMDKTGEAGQYQDYSADAVSSSDAEYKILSFSATWCPSCRTLDKNLNEELSAIPANLDIFKVDYDSNTDLRKKYGITTQHTQVILDADGNVVKKFSGGNNLDDLLAQL